MYHGFHNSTQFSPAPPLLNDLSTNTSICSNMTLIRECDTLTIGNYTIISPALLPCCLGALIIGLTLAKKTIKMQTTNSLFYALTFAMVGCMMTDAGWNDCLLPNLFPHDKFIHQFYAIVDVGLTSTIGYSFLILGLLDAGILSQKSKITWGIYIVGTILIFYGWIKTIVGHWYPGFFILYMGVVGVGCGTWTIIQLHLVIGQKDWASLKWLLFAGLHGGFGFFSLLDFKLSKWICENIDCHFATAFIWFLVTDTAIYFIYKFYVSRIDFLKRRALQKQQLSLINPYAYVSINN